MWSTRRAVPGSWLLAPFFTTAPKWHIEISSESTRYSQVTPDV